MHIRRSGVKRTNSIFLVGGDKVKVVESYKYLGCIVNEHMDYREMVKERAKARRGELSAWLWRCRASMGEVGRWRGLRREKRKCAVCDSGELENVKHFLMRCKAWNREREELMEKMRKLVAGFDEISEERSIEWILDLACRNGSIERCCGRFERRK